ncbi:MAG: endonuclease III [Spirochaetales bacterium]|nr:endonuclease III [Candidatus Physcosoma equi]
MTVILSGSSTDKQAELSADRLFSRFPDVSAVSKATEEEIGEEIHSSGLYRAKAHNIHELAMIVEKRGGIPETMEELVLLPGVGEKTAACYLSAILGQPAVVVDTHFARTSQRLGIATHKERGRIAEEIRGRFPPECWNRLSDTVNLLGRTYCRPVPKCGECFMNGLCPSAKAPGKSLKTK